MLSYMANYSLFFTYIWKVKEIANDLGRRVFQERKWGDTIRGDTKTNTERKVQDGIETRGHMYRSE